MAIIRLRPGLASTLVTTPVLVSVSVLVFLTGVSVNSVISGIIFILLASVSGLIILTDTLSSVVHFTEVDIL